MNGNGFDKSDSGSENNKKDIVEIKIVSTSKTGNSSRKKSRDEPSGRNPLAGT